MRIIVNGATGRIGRLLCSAIEADPEHVLTAACSNKDLSKKLLNIGETADVIIDFSNHQATEDVTRFAMEKKIPVVIGTTGQTPEEMQMIRECAQAVPVFFAANMSIGVALLCELAKNVMRVFPAAELEIIECHHDQKLDVPSGTALMCAKAVQQMRPESKIVLGRQEQGLRDPKEIAIHSLRYGKEVGTHTMIFSCGNETLELCHKAEDRALFADGALAAARFIVGQAAGLYGMGHLMEV